MKVLDVMKSWVGLAWPDPRFRAIVEPYWQPGYGSTCMVVVTGALERAGVPKEHLNRGANWKPGDHMRPLIEYAKSKGAYQDAPSSKDLKPGDVYFLARNNPEGADHAGFVEKNDGGPTIITLDGGQGDQFGHQMINRVIRPVDTYDPTGGMIGTRALLWRIDTSKIVPEASNVDSEAIWAYLDQVESDWEKTQREVAKQQAESIAGTGPPLPFSRADFLAERNAWRVWYLEQKDELWLDDDVYEAARQWHAKQKIWADMLARPPKGQTEVPKQKPDDSPFGGFGSGFGTGIVVLGAALAGAAYYFSKPKRGRSK